MDRWTEMALFVQVAETGSLSRAAEALGLSNAAASRHLSALEERLGARLVERNTRRLYLTEPGQEFLRRSKAILADLQDAESAVNATTLNPSGTLRVTASLSFSMQHIAPLLPEYTRRYPNVTRARRDGQPLPGPDRQQHRRGDPHARVRAGLQHHHPPAGGDAAHPGGVAGLPGARRHAARAGGPGPASRCWSTPTPTTRTNCASRATARPPPSSVKGVLESNDGQVLRAAALEGLGILVQPTYILYDDIVAGRLVPVLDAWDLPRLTVNLAYPSRKHLSAKVRTFIDFIAEHFERMEYERKWTARFGY